MSPIVLHRYPHDRAAFTEGLVLDGDVLYESTGEFGTSTLRQVDVVTGQVLRSVALPGEEFGEGLARVGERLIQLTYRNGIAHVYDAATFEETARFEYEGEGWGLCYDGARLLMTNGDDRLYFRDPDTFELLGSVPLTMDGRAFAGANELECVRGEVFANLFPTEWILRIDPETGRVLTRIDARGLLGADERDGIDVLNGIAFDEETDRFLLTGKYWPSLFEVELSGATPPRPAPSSGCSLGARWLDGALSPNGIGPLAMMLGLAGFANVRRRCARRGQH